jgi:Na+-transporting NADH:ubiquinone oxidoreductase subunit NqrC
MIIGTITLLSILFFGGADFSFEKSFKPFIKEVIEEKDRQKEILDVTKQADSAVKQWRNEVKKVWAEELKRLLTNYDATEAEFEVFFDRSEQSRKAMQAAILDARYQFVGLMSEAEWNEMYAKIHAKAAEEKAKREAKERG